MKIRLIIAILFASNGLAFSEEKLDSICGEWIWDKTFTVVVKPDGTASTIGHKAKWQFVEDSPIGRKYLFNWDDGAIVDKVTLATNRKAIFGTHQNGTTFSAAFSPTFDVTSLTYPAGLYRWFNGVMFIIRRDGSATYKDRVGRFVWDDSKKGTCHIEWEKHGRFVMTLAKDKTRFIGTDGATGLKATAPKLTDAEARDWIKSNVADKERWDIDAKGPE